MKIIPLTQGKFALVDDADYEAVSQFKWHAWKSPSGNFYAARNIRKPDGKKTTQLLHQFLLPGVALIDHRDGDGLNNQRYNLRPATHQQNAQGFRQPKIGTTSRFRGVRWDENAGKWRASISIDGKDSYLGLFTEEADAARAWNVAARQHRGEFAGLNFV